MATVQGKQIQCRSADGNTFLLTEIPGSVGQTGKQFTLPNGGIVNGLADGTYQISASGEILQPI